MEEHCDVDAPSVRFGTALQAAAYQGNEEMVHLLLDNGASVDARGGEYGCALIAAVVQNQPRVVKILLREKAYLFTPGGRYISALYQAVDFENLEIAHMLLEKGAWLTTYYNELLDLAAEHNDTEMIQELERYDVQLLHQKRSRGTSKSSPSADQIEQYRQDDQKALQPTGSMGIALFIEAVKLKGQVGKWTGIKGVRLLRIALLEYDLDPKILETIRPHVHSFPSLQRFFTDAIGNRFGGQLQPVRHTDVEDEDRNLEASSKHVDYVPPDGREGRKKRSGRRIEYV
jgi:hypothetical protein